MKVEIEKHKLDFIISLLMLFTAISFILLYFYCVNLSYKKKYYAAINWIESNVTFEDPLTIADTIKVIEDNARQK